MSNISNVLAKWWELKVTKAGIRYCPLTISEELSLIFFYQLHLHLPEKRNRRKKHFNMGSMKNLRKDSLLATQYIDFIVSKKINL